MTIEHIPPRLSDEGAQLLADVLASRRARVDGSDVVAPNSAAADVPSSRPSNGLRFVLPATIVLGGLIAALVLATMMRTTTVAVEVAGVTEERSPVVAVDAAVDVVLERLEPPQGEVRLADLSVVSAMSETVDINRFEIRAEDTNGRPLTTIVRFDQAELQPESPTQVMVRVEQATSATVLVVRLDGAIIERIPLG